MTPALVLAASPHAGGVTDRLAALLAQGLARAGAQARLTALRDVPIAPCTGCGACALPPHRCPLSQGSLSGARPADRDASDDGTEALFAAMRASPLVCLCAPVWFYALPAQCKALVDRAQRIWQAEGGANLYEETREKPVGKALILLTAGRPKGERLFEGPLLTLRCFFATLRVEIAETHGYRGLDSPRELSTRPEVTDEVYRLGRTWGERLAAGAVDA